MGKTPGMFAFRTASGKGDSHRSGFHSSASSPHSSFIALQPRREMQIALPAGTCTSDIHFPFLPRMGDDNGMMVSVVTLGCNIRLDVYTDSIGYRRTL